MQDFDLYLPTHIVFGKGRVAELGKLTTGRGERVLITEFPAGSPGLEPREECGLSKLFESWPKRSQTMHIVFA